MTELTGELLYMALNACPLLDRAFIYSKIFLYIQNVHITLFNTQLFFLNEPNDIFLPYSS